MIAFPVLQHVLFYNDSATRPVTPVIGRTMTTCARCCTRHSITVDYNVLFPTVDYAAVLRFHLFVAVDRIAATDLPIAGDAATFAGRSPDVVLLRT